MSEIVKIFNWEHKKTPKQVSPSERENESNNVSVRSSSPQTPSLQPLPRTQSKNKMNERLKRRRSFEGTVNPPYPVNPPRPMYTMNPSPLGSFYNYPIYPTYPTYPTIQHTTLIYNNKSYYIPHLILLKVLIIPTHLLPIRLHQCQQYNHYISIPPLFNFNVNALKVFITSMNICFHR